MGGPVEKPFAACVINTRAAADTLTATSFEDKRQPPVELTFDEHEDVVRTLSPGNFDYCFVFPIGDAGDDPVDLVQTRTDQSRTDYLYRITVDQDSNTRCIRECRGAC